MEEQSLKNKNESIKVIWEEILKTFGDDFFSIVNFWDSDNFALGFVKKNKLIYLSTWEYREYDNTKCYAEFELIDEKSFEEIKSIKQIHGILLKDF